MSTEPLQGILLLNKPEGKTSFSLVSLLRKALGVKKIGHAGTLDPFATGLMVMLIGKKFTTQSNQFLNQDKEYLAEVRLGAATDSHDKEGNITCASDFVPDLDAINEAITHFQGEIEQIPPMFSAKKIGGKKLYELARQGKEVERAPVKVTLQTTLLSYHYPKLCLRVKCSKGTYIRSLAHDIGNHLGCFAHLTALQRIRCGPYHLQNSFQGDLFQTELAQLRKELANFTFYA
jgi:tRNA pseudouridine55 synthase